MMKKLLSALLAFLLAAALTATALLALAAQAPGQLQAMLGQADDALLSAQRESVTAAIRAQAGRYGFDPAPIEALADAETLRALNDQAAGWYASLLTEDFDGEEPYFTLEGLEDAVAGDPGFQAAVEPALQRTVARDEVAASVEKALKAALLPARASVLTMARVKAEEVVSVTGLLAGLPRYALWAALADLALILLLVALHAKDLRLGLIWVCAAVAACGLMLLTVWFLLTQLRIPGQAVRISATGGLMLRRIAAALRPWLLWLPLAAAIAGEAAVLILARERKRRS